LRFLEGLTMAGAFTVESIRHGLARIAARMDAVADELNALDAALGDGDLGVTMVRGTRAVMADSAELPEDLGLALLKCAQGFTKTSGSTFGTLLATGLMAAARITKGRSEVAWDDFSSLLEEALTAMSVRGKAQLGDKTVLDAIDAIRRAVEGVDDPREMVIAALDEAQAVLDGLRQQPARQGRARIYADRSIGRDDPGMIAVQRALEGLADWPADHSANP
jgi:phosphoenolpyruvate---glycerone phosphotransferase subunit DhaL